MQEAKRFDGIDRAFITIMCDTARNPNVLEACSVEGRLATLQELLASLETCQKSLSEYLDTKRCGFPRFYFISDVRFCKRTLFNQCVTDVLVHNSFPNLHRIHCTSSVLLPDMLAASAGALLQLDQRQHWLPLQDELLSVLGTSDATSIQEHMLKLFDNCAQLKFGRANKAITGMMSSEGETFNFRQPVAVEGATEAWMTAMEAEMKATLFQISKEGVYYYAKKARNRWIADSLGMVTIGGSQIWWTWETEDVFERMQGGDKHAMKEFFAKQSAQLAQLTVMVRTDLAPLTRKKVNQLIIVEVHAKDIIDTFVRDSIMDARCAVRRLHHPHPLYLAVPNNSAGLVLSSYTAHLSTN